MFRIIIWMFEIGALVAVGTFAFLLLCATGRSFSGILRAAANLVIASVISAFVGLGVGLGGIGGGAADPVANALLATIFALPVAVWALDRIGRRRAGRAGSIARSRRGAPGREPLTDAQVVTAWTRAGRLAPAQRFRLAGAREACAYVLQWSEEHPFDMDVMECAVLIRKRLPELVEKTTRYCELADRTERRTAIAAMIGDIDDLGRMALRRVEQSKLLLGESLAATRAHIASRTNETPAF